MDLTLLLLLSSPWYLVKDRSRGQHDLSILLNSNYLRILCTVTCFKLDKLQEVRLLGFSFRVIPILGDISILGCPGLCTIEWICFFLNLLKGSLTHGFCGTYVVTITIYVSIRNILLWKFVITITSFTYFLTNAFFSYLSSSFLFLYVDLFSVTWVC